MPYKQRLAGSEGAIRLAIANLGKHGVSLILSCLIVSACAAGMEEWPPAAGEPEDEIYVSLDTWHGMIAYPVREEGSASPPAYEEWGYAERAWYLEDRQGLGGLLRALFWPSAGTVEFGRHTELWAVRTPNQPADLFTFRLSHESFLRLRRHLHATRAATEPIARAGASRFYPAVRSYHLFHHCHQYVAHALKEAGLPVAPFAALTRTSLAWQLRRAERMAQTSRDAKEASFASRYARARR